MDFKYQKIILSGKRCTGKSTLLWELQKRLNYPIFSISMFLRDYIRQYHLSEKEIDEKRVELANEIDQRILSLIQGDNTCLIEAKIFGQLKEKFTNTCNILLTANEQIQYQRDAFREGIDYQKAKDRVEKKENEWYQKMAQIYGFKDFFDPKYYDLVIDTTHLTREQVADRVFEWLKS